MYAVLMAAALTMGSGDGRDGVTDGRMVDATPPDAMLREGMTYDVVQKLLGKANSEFDTAQCHLSHYVLKPTRQAYKEILIIRWNADTRVEEWKIKRWER